MRLKETSSSEIQQQLLQRLEALFGKDGYQIVELNYAALKRCAHFSIVLFHPAGVSLDACAELHKIADVEIERLQAQGQKVSENNDYSLELSSPGLGRCLRSRREFQVFRGQQIRCLLAEQWLIGVLLGLEEAADGTLTLALERQQPAEAEVSESSELTIEALRFPLEELVKVELDS